MFGKDVSYPSTLEDLYTVPEVEMTDTCDGIDCQVLGVFGDACSVNVVLEFSGVNGFTLPENVQLFGESPGSQETVSAAGKAASIIPMMPPAADTCM